MSSIINCNICNSKDYKLLYTKNGWNIVKCRTCGLVYVNPQPTNEELREFYASKYDYDYQTENEERLFKIARKTLACLEKILHNDTGNLLEIGCGRGYFLKIAKEQGWNVTGVEISEDASDFAKSKLNLNVVSGELLDAKFPDKEFDVVIMRHSLEHVSNPSEVLDEISRILGRGGGLLRITGPHIYIIASKLCGKAWEWLSPPAHLYFFSPSTLKQILQKYGFGILQINTQRGDAKNIFFMMFISFFYTLGLYEYVRKKIIKNNQMKQHNNVRAINTKRKTITKIMKVVEKAFYIPYLCLIPIMLVACKLNLGEELTITAKKVIENE